ncbi:MAG: polysaccharide deacetylase family protein [Clostridia bacterium]|nr:polysaccharide deacetylase family protein [Clostridia bacterium]
MAHIIDKNYFPGWVRKSVTFTIDDGNVNMDRKFLDIVRPAGIKGTFNLCSHGLGYMDADGYRDFYRGYEISNHAKHHVVALNPNWHFNESSEPFDKTLSDENFVYPHEESGAYWVHYNLRYPNNTPRQKPQGWSVCAVNETYLKYVEAGRRELEEIFGEGNVRGFVYPGGKGCAIPVVDDVKAQGYFYIRKTGNLKDSTGFSMPADRQEWTYNASHNDLLEVMEKYEKYADDGELKFFSFGVHSVDYEHADKWDDLREFARLYGNRPDTYFYGGVAEIFDYEDAIASLRVTDDEIINDSNLDLYVTVDGERKIVAAGTALKL